MTPQRARLSTNRAYRERPILKTEDGVTHRLSWADQALGRWRMRCSCGWLDAKTHLIEDWAIRVANGHTDRVASPREVLRALRHPLEALRRSATY
jgi:hypothetical protein